MREISEEIFYPDENIVIANSKAIDFLKKKSAMNKRKRARLCTHQDTNDLVQEMLIVHTKGNYVRPHKHLNKSESLHVLEGSGDMIFFDENGKVTRVVEMGDYLSGKIFYYRIAEPIFHTLIVNSPVIVFHEATKGPFDRSDTIWADWSPEENDSEKVREYMNKLVHLKNEEIQT